MWGSKKDLKSISPIEARSGRSTGSRTNSASFNMKDQDDFTNTMGVDGRRSPHSNRFIDRKLEKEYMRHLSQDATFYVRITLRTTVFFLLLIGVISAALSSWPISISSITLVFILSPVLMFASSQGRVWYENYRLVLVVVYLILGNVTVIQILTSSESSMVDFVEKAVPSAGWSNETTASIGLSDGVCRAMFASLYSSLSSLMSSGLLLTAPLALPFAEASTIVAISAVLQILASMYVQLFEGGSVLVFVYTTTLTAFVTTQICVASAGVDTERRRLFLHERKLVRKLSSFRKVLHSAEMELQLKHMDEEEVDEKEAMLMDFLNAEDRRSKLDDWGILPSAVQFDKKLGAGAFGVVYKGLYRQREVAIKTMTRDTISERNLERFTSEIFLLTRLHHPNIIGFVGTVLEIDNLYILLEYAGKGDLKVCMRSPTAKEWNFHNHKLRVLLETCKGMEYLHSLDPIVVHRDLKCENVLVTEHLVCKISDFGESRDIVEATMTVVGTPYYIAPEVFRGEHYDESADVFSFSIMMCSVGNNGELDDFFMGAFERLGIDKSQGTSGMVIPSKFAMGWRPSFPPEWEEELPTLTHLIRRCWHPAHAHRPTFQEIHEILDKFWNTNNILIKEHAHDVEKARRKSERRKTMSGVDVSNGKNLERKETKCADSDEESKEDKEFDDKVGRIVGSNDEDEVDSSDSDFEESLLMTVRTKKAKAALDGKASKIEEDEYSNLPREELIAMLMNEKHQVHALHCENKSMSELLDPAVVTRIKMQANEEHRRASVERKKSAYFTELAAYNFDLMAQPALPKREQELKRRSSSIASSLSNSTLNVRGLKAEDETGEGTLYDRIQKLRSNEMKKAVNFAPDS